ncbi:MAG: hypothetical protein C7N36_11175 [Bacteroidetes bacterium]|nr:MAG: hypothetical protein C7N36_11175 [Bacteroidota bacterium]
MFFGIELSREEIRACLSIKINNVNIGMLAIAAATIQLVGRGISKCTPIMRLITNSLTDRSVADLA